MVAVQVGFDKKTFYIIGDFWDIVDRLKGHQARFRFRARRWRWPSNHPALISSMSPYYVLEGSFSEAQALQLEYDRVTIAPTQQWVKSHARIAQVSVEWWEEARFKRKDDARTRKVFEQYRDRVALALTVVDTGPAELEREQIVALQQTRRTLEKYEERVVKWLGERAKQRRREEVMARFEREMGLTRQDLLEAEAARGPDRLALYEELAGLEWQPHEVSELKTVVKHFLKEYRQRKTKAA
ncbi:MAG: hypothetical protein JWP00_901 [Chloroflexi bacterium]|jgi:hypothetical protein|nr:hypothetical protein [Chloroflexota bacterium]